MIRLVGSTVNIARKSDTAMTPAVGTSCSTLRRSPIRVKPGGGDGRIRRKSISTRVDYSRERDADTRLIINNYHRPLRTRTDMNECFIKCIDELVKVHDEIAAENYKHTTLVGRLKH